MIRGGLVVAVAIAVLTGCGGSHVHTTHGDASTGSASPTPSTTAATASTAPSTASPTPAGSPRSCQGVAPAKPAPNHLLQQCRLADGPVDLMAAYGSLWVSSHEDATIYRLDPKALRAVPFTSGAQPADLAFGDGSVWSTNYDGTITRVDVSAGQSSSFGNFKHLCGQSVVVHDAIWVGTCDVSHPAIERVALPAGTVTATVPTGNNQASMLLAGGGLLVASYFPGKLMRIDPDSGKVAWEKTIPDCPLFDRTSLGFGSLWLPVAGGCGVAPQGGAIERVDPRSGRVTDRLTPPGIGPPFETTVGDGAVWVVDTSGAIDRLDPKTGRATPWSSLHSTQVGAEATNGALWAYSFDQGTLYRLSVR